MMSSTVILARIYSETMNRLEVLSKRVAEGRDVMQASEFCRWLYFSGIIKLLEEHDNEETAPLKIDSFHLRFTCDDLAAACNERFAKGDWSVKMEEDEYRSLHEKIDRVAGYLSKLSVAPGVAVASQLPATGFEIISGGLSESPATSAAESSA